MTNNINRDRMYSGYQEDINANPFFKTLKRNKLYSAVERNCWLVCVPQLSAVTGLKVSQDILGIFSFLLLIYYFLNFI